MRVRLVVAWMLLCGPAGPALAQTPGPGEPPPQTSATTPPAPVEEPTERIPLSLHEAIALGIENNTDVQLVRYDPPIAEYEHDAAWGVHDPNLFGNYTYTSSNLPVASSFLPTQLVERTSDGQAGISGLVPKLGWTYQLSYAGDSTTTNSFVQTLGTTYTNDLTASLTAPLLKGAWWGAAWTQVELTGIGSELAREQFRQRLMDIVGGPPGVPLEQNPGIEFAYWTLAARKQELEVANKSLETARALLQQTKAQYDVGVVSRVEVVEAEAGVADREFRQITADNLYRNAQDELIDRVYGPRLTPTSRLEIEPTDRPESYVTFAIDPELSMQRALERRPELTIAQQQVEQGKIGLKFARNERLPQIDLVGSYGTHGLAGNDPNCPFTTTFNPATGFCVSNTTGANVLPRRQPAGIGRDYGDADDFWFDGQDNRVWVGGALFSIPIPNTTARSNVAISELELRRAFTNVRRVEQDIVKDVRDAVRNLASALEGVEAAERFVAASAEQLRAERIRLEHGESTPFDVLLREEDLVTAESQRITALRIYHGSVTALDRAQGTLLEDRGIVLEDALPLR
jgi:outer membrane protein TolC